MNRYVRRVAMFAIAFAGGAAMAQLPQPVMPAPAVSAAAPAAPAQIATTTPALTEADLTTFFDGLVPFALERGDVAGGVIAVVKDGKLLFARGYGYADLETRAVPSPQTTLFRPGSVSKLFTWTAAMQLVEQGKLDLNADVNQYLDFKIRRVTANRSPCAT
ncbi:D-aminopeptidase [Rhodanobacter lindaniclasticus]